MATGQPVSKICPQGLSLIRRVEADTWTPHGMRFRRRSGRSNLMEALLGREVLGRINTDNKNRDDAGIFFSVRAL